MAARYYATNTKTNTVSATVPMNNMTGGGTKRVRLYHLIIGSPAAPGNQASSFAIKRTSARGTQSTSFTPNPVDPADGAALFTFDLTWSANPTITASSDLLNIPMNQQATVQWMVAPENGLIVPASAGAGLALVSEVATSAASHQYGHYFEE